jgi:predicted nucleotidyltransferase
MRQQSSPSVRIRFLDKPAVWRAVKEHARFLVQRYPEIRRIVLFGSFARDRAVPGSDLDLLIVLREASERFLDRIPRFLPRSFPVGVDVFPYTQAELARMLTEENPFIRRALAEGIELFPNTTTARSRDRSE